MTDKNQDASGADANSDVQGGGNQNTTEDKVAYETYKRTLTQLKKAQDEKKELQSKVDNVESEKLERERKQRDEREKRLEKDGEYKKLLELKENELAEFKSKVEILEGETNNAKKTITDTVKLHAFYESLPGKIKKREYLNFVDLDGIVLNPETKEIEKSSVELVVNKFMDGYGELVDTSHMGKLPAGAPGSGDKVDYSNWKGMSSKDMKNNLKLMIDKRKTGG